MAQTQTRMTRQRAVILEELRKLKSHPTADELYSIVRERLPRISLGTVYRIWTFWQTEAKFAVLRQQDQPSVLTETFRTTSMCAAFTVAALVMLKPCSRPPLLRACTQWVLRAF